MTNKCYKISKIFFEIFSTKIVRDKWMQAGQPEKGLYDKLPPLFLRVRTRNSEFIEKRAYFATFFFL